jgi:hypothetical protein
MTEPKGGCEACGKRVPVYAVARWNDLRFWCTTECWVNDMRGIAAKAEENRRFLLTGVKIYMPGVVR